MNEDRDKPPSLDRSKEGGFEAILEKEGCGNNSLKCKGSDLGKFH